MKILITTGIFPPDIGGPATYTYSLVREFLRLGHEVSVITYGEPQKIDNIKILGISRGSNIIVRYIKYFLAVLSRGGEVDLIFCFDVFSVGLPSVLANLFLRKKIILRLGGDFFWEKACNAGKKVTLVDYYKEKMYSRNFVFWLYGFVYRRLSYIIFSTEMQRDLHVEVFPFINTKTGVVGNAFPDLSVSEIQPGYKIRNSFITVGRFIKLKNFDTMIEVFKNIHDEGHEIFLDIYGRGPEKEQLQELIEDCEAQAYIKLHESLPHHELIKRTGEAYACLLISASEVSPNFGLECLKLRKPLIMTRETGLRHIFANRAKLINPMDFKEIKNAVFAMISEKEYAKLCPKVKDEELIRSWSDVAQDSLKIISNVLDKR